MPKGVNMASINAKIQAAIDDALAKEVANAVKQELSSAVVSTVYSAGDPFEYIRRGQRDGSGGLGDRQTMNSTVSSGVLTVSPDAKPKRENGTYGKGYNNNQSLAYNINHGYSPSMDDSRWYNVSRPFVDDARDSLVSKYRHISALAIGLQVRLSPGMQVTQVTGSQGSHFNINPYRGL